MRRPGFRPGLISSIVLGSLIGIIVAATAVLALHRWHDSQSDLHERLHRAVPLDAQESRFLDMKEREFAQHRRRIEAQVQGANERLAAAISADPRWSPEVEAVTRQVERAAAELQRATLVHVFEMRAGLKPQHRPAYDKVLIDALRHGSR